MHRTRIAALLVLSAYLSGCGTTLPKASTAAATYCAAVADAAGQRAAVLSVVGYGIAAGAAVTTGYGIARAASTDDPSPKERISNAMFPIIGAVLGVAAVAVLMRSSDASRLEGAAHDADGLKDADAKKAACSTARRDWANSRSDANAQLIASIKAAEAKVEAEKAKSAAYAAALNKAKVPVPAVP